MKEWSSILQPGTDGQPAVKVHRGAEARRLRSKYAGRIIPSRWHEKWKDMGDTFDKVTEKRQQAALYEKIQILDDYIDLIRINEKD